MMTRPKARTRIAALTLAALVPTASAWTPAFACGNPLESVGIEHNVYLGCLMRDGGDTSVSQLQRLVEECGFNPGTSTEEFVARYSPLVEVDPYLTVAQRMAPYRDSYTAYQFSYFTRIDQVIAAAQSTAEADAEFAQLETEAIEHLSTSTAAEQSIFAALSTARHSLQYWSKATEGTPVLATKARAERKLGKFWKVLIVVGADLAGAAGGTLIGGPIVGAAAASGSSGGAAVVLRD